MYFKTPVQMTQIVFGGGRFSNISNVWEILETQIVGDIRRSTSRRHKQWEISEEQQPTAGFEGGTHLVEKNNFGNNF